MNLAIECGMVLEQILQSSIFVFRVQQVSEFIARIQVYQSCEHMLLKN